MKIGHQFFEEVQAALRRASAAEELKLTNIEIFLGANPYADRAAIIFETFATPLPVPLSEIHRKLDGILPGFLGRPAPAPQASTSETLALFTARFAAALLKRELRIEMSCGSHVQSNGCASGWVEFLPGAPVGPAVETALVAVAGAAGTNGETRDLWTEQIGRLRKLCAPCRPNKMSSFLIASARARDIPYLSLGMSRTIWQFGWGSRGRTFLGAACNDDGYVGFNIAKNKLVAKHLFRELGLPTPRWNGLPLEGDAAKAVSRVGWPCVVKPVDSSSGDGVTTNIRTMAQLVGAVSLARSKWSRKLLIEAHEPGHDHRLMVIGGRMFAAVRRDPASVSGNGKSTIRQLIEELNVTREGPPEEVEFLSPVSIDEALLHRLHSHDMNLETVLPMGVKFVLSSAANRTLGGSASDVTAQVHPQVRRWAEQLAMTVGLRVAGIDYICEDISRDPAEIGGGFIEINATPGLQVLAAAGLDRIALGSAVLGQEPGRIPVDLVLTARERIEDALRNIGRETGHAIIWPEGAEIDEAGIDARGLTPFDIVGAMLRHKHVDRCTIVWSDDDMMLHGLPVDRIRRTSIVGVVPDEKWLSLLNRISTELVVNDIPSAAERITT